MKLNLSLVLLLLTSIPLWSYSDFDIDGVDDAKDLCPNTPFNVIVDKNGCDINKNFPGILTLQIGNDLSFDTLSNTNSNLTLFVNYQYKNWDISLSSSNYSINNLNLLPSSQNDLYLTFGHYFQYQKLSTKLSVGTKFSFSTDDTLKRDNDYYASINFDYQIAKKQNLYLYYNYTKSGDNHTIDYDNFHSFSLGTGYALTDKWYSALSYSYTGAYYPESEAYKAISWYNSYAFSDKYYLSGNYAYTLNHSTYRHILSFNIGVRFE